jgi:2'-5' RNA ligase
MAVGAAPDPRHPAVPGESPRVAFAMRLFIATLLSSDHQSFYDRGLRELLRVHRDVLRPVPRNSAHITCAFLGLVEDRLLAEITEAVDVSVRGRGAIDAQFGPPAVLFSGSEARLISAPVTSGDAALARLSADLRAALHRALPGVAISGMKTPHVTLARFRAGTRRGRTQPIVDALARDRATLTPPPDRISRVQVISSDLTPAGAVYTVRAEVLL